MLPIALSSRMGLHFFAGEFAEAAALVDEFATVNEVMGNHLLPYGALALAAWQGRQDIVSGLIRTTFAEAAERGEGMGLTIVDYSIGRPPQRFGAVPGSHEQQQSEEPGTPTSSASPPGRWWNSSRPRREAATPTAQRMHSSC